MSLNLRRDVPQDGPYAWTNRVDALAATIEQERPHVLGTQEGLPHQLADLDARLPGYRRVGGDRAGTGTDEHVALFYDPSRLVLVAHGDVWLSDEPDKPGSRSWGNRLPRHATWARFTDQDSGRSFTVVNTHLDHESSTARERAASFLADRFPDAVMMGDFNDAPGGAVWARLTKGRHDAHKDVAVGTYHGFTGEGKDRIDWILAPEPWRIVRADVLRGRIVSDHHPIVADLA